MRNSVLYIGNLNVIPNKKENNNWSSIIDKQDNDKWV